MQHHSVYFCETLDPQCLSTQLSAWRARSPSGTVLAMVAESELERVPALQSACREAGLLLLGALFPGLVWQRRFVASGAVLLYLPWTPTHALIEGLDVGDPSQAGRIAKAVSDHLDPGPAQSLFMVFDTMIGNIASILDALYLELADAVRYIGVNAGSESFRPMPCLFDQERLIGGGVLCILLPADWPSALIHGYLSHEEKLVTTSTLGNKIVGIDWKPAFPVYREKVLQRYGAALDRENFYHYAVHFPFGLELASGETLVRIPVALDEDDGILCVGEVPANALLTLIQSPEVDSLDTARALASVLGTERRGHPLLFFYCAGRRMHLGANAERELGAFEREIRAPLVGALTLGEIGGASYPLLHNAAVVGIRWEGLYQGPS